MCRYVWKTSQKLKYYFYYYYHRHYHIIAYLRFRLNMHTTRSSYLNVRFRDYITLYLSAMSVCGVYVYDLSTAISFIYYTDDTCWRIRLRQITTYNVSIHYNIIIQYYYVVITIYTYTYPTYSLRSRTFQFPSRASSQ